LPLEGGYSSECEGSDSAEDFAELLGGSLIEAKVGSVGEAGDFLKAFSGGGIVAFLEQEHWHAQLGELHSWLDQLVAVLFAGITDEH
jgi:hypothetical protein